ncbi:MAG: hypothetical protein A3G88_07435 [Omnitrophica WOR_2 bacterium RIFCSPLOWO2_12_FULL_63_16]|nr:MAG: hypothetical protein A3G88_07435 [Omnitrophica WOR_2 bacterium RIFCSPLOWO2_12_FULL_63_16]
MGQLRVLLFVLSLVTCYLSPVSAWAISVSGTAATTRGSLGGLSIDLFTVSDSDQVDSLLGGVKIVHDSNVANTQRIAASLLAFQWLACVGVVGERLDGAA